MFRQRPRLLKALIPILAIVAIAVVHARAQQRGTVPSCAESGSCSGDVTQPFLELLQPR